MIKSILISFFDESNIINIGNYVLQDEEETNFIEINIGNWHDDSGGEDGNSVLMGISEFQEFIDECAVLLAHAKNLEKRYG